MNPRILHVIGGLSGGGAETQIKLLLRGLSDRNWQTGVIYLHDDPGFTNREGITMLPVERGPRLGLAKLSTRINRAIDSFRPDVIHTWLPEVMTLPAAIYGRRKGIPVLSSQRSSMRHVTSFKNRVRDWFIPLNHYLADRVVCNFPYEQEPALVRKVISARNGIVIRNGFATPRVTAVEKPAWLREDTLKILFVGRLVAHKKPDLLLEAFCQLHRQGHKLQLAFYGQGPLEAAMRQRANAANLREQHDVAFMGYQPDWQSYAGYYDLFAFPTLAEGMPNALVEAMRLKLPAIATDIFEINSFVQHGRDAWLVEPGSYDALLEGLRTLIANPGLRADLASNGSRLAEGLSVDNMVENYISLYRDMAKPLSV